MASTLCCLLRPPSRSVPFRYNRCLKKEEEESQQETCSSRPMRNLGKEGGVQLSWRLEVALLIYDSQGIFISQIRMNAIQVQALSAVGRCQTFEAAADGYGRGEGCSVVLLQPSSSAGDDIAILQVLRSPILVAKIVCRNLGFD